MIRLILILTCITQFLSLEAQKISGKVVVAGGETAVPFANVSFSNSARGTVTNEDGKFEITVKNPENESSLVISHLGYKNLEVSTDALESGDAILRLEFLGYGLPTVMISDVSAKSILLDALKKIDINYPQQTHLLTGFYNEKLIHQDGRLFTYGEGILETIKKKYRSKPKLQESAGNKLKEETGLVKGFFEDFQHLLEDKEGGFYKFPSISEGGTMPHTLDILKSSLSFLLKGVVDDYEYKFSGVTFDGDEDAWVIGFEPKDASGLYAGEIVVHQQSLAILSSKFMLAPKAIKIYNDGISSTKLKYREYRVEYKQQRDRFTLQQCNVSSIFIHEPTNDTLYNTLNFTSTNRQFRGKFKIEESKQIGILDVMSDYIPQVDDYWKEADVILRSDVVENAIAKKRARMANLKAIEFITGPFSEVVDKAQKERKLIFVDVTADSCEPCKIAHAGIFRHPDFIAAINSGYVPYKVDVEIDKDHPIANKLNISTSPSSIILSPWGHILQQNKGYRNPIILANLLNRLNDLLELNRVFSAVEELRSDESTDDAIAAKELLSILSGSERMMKRDLELSFLGPKDSWGNDEKRKFIFEVKVGAESEKIQEYFLSNIEDFRSMYSAKEVNEKLYKIALFKYSKKENAALLISQFLELNLQGEHEKYKSQLQVDYYTYFLPNSEYKIDAQISHLSNFPPNSWDEVKISLLGMIMEAEWKDQLVEIKEIHDRYRSGAVDYEWLDLRCLLLYQLGNEKAAYNLLNEIKALALAHGINYKPSIYRLQE